MAEIKFEDALKKLEAIVESLESGELTLDASLAKYGEGVRLAAVCQEKLDGAKKKIEMLVKTREGGFRLEPFGEEKGKAKKGRKKEVRGSAEGDEGLF